MAPPPPAGTTPRFGAAAALLRCLAMGPVAGSGDLAQLALAAPLAALARWAAARANPSRGNLSTFRKDGFRVRNTEALNPKRVRVWGS